MERRRSIFIILCVAMLITVLAGCGEPTQWYDDSEGNEGSEGSEQPADGMGDFISMADLDFDAAFDAYPPDTIMVIAGDYPITWEELFYNIFDTLSYIESTYGVLPNIFETTDSGVSFSELVINYAVENALVFRGIQYGASLSDITLDDSYLELMETDYNSVVDRYGGEEAFLENLWEYNGIKNIALFRYLFSINYLADQTFNVLFGANGSLLSDEDVAIYTADDGYLMAKHILRLTTEDDSDTPRSEIEEILDQLNAYDGNDFDEFFDSLMLEHSEDPGLEPFPNGYLFQEGDMAPVFYDACLQLDIGDYSDIVETSYGYHIIYRIPINYDVVPASYGTTNESDTLRSITALKMYDELRDRWSGLLDLVYTDEFETLELSTIFTT